MPASGRGGLISVVGSVGRPLSIFLFHPVVSSVDRCFGTFDNWVSDGVESGSKLRDHSKLLALGTRWNKTQEPWDRAHVKLL